MLKEESFLKKGEPPGTLTFVGEAVSSDTIINLAFFNKDEYFIKELSLEEFRNYEFESDYTYWIDFVGYHDSDYVKSVGEIFKINALFLEDVMNSNQRPKYETDGNSVLFIVKDVKFSQTDNYSLEFEHISVFLISNIIISFRREANNKNFEMLKKRITDNVGSIRKKKSDYLLYAIIDSIIDSYFFIIDKIDDILTDFEDTFIETPDIESLKDIYKLKREIVILKKIFTPIKNAIRDLEHFLPSDSENFIFIRDLYDHSLQISDNLETIREIISSMFELYLSSNGNKMNLIMKTLTLISSIFIPLSFITGFYGMNFINIPGLASEHGALIVFVIMLSVAIVMMMVFKIKKWF